MCELREKGSELINVTVPPLVPGHSQSKSPVRLPDHVGNNLFTAISKANVFATFVGAPKYYDQLLATGLFRMTQSSNKKGYRESFSANFVGIGKFCS
jgi:hypothetical protein